ncbi:MAG: HAMP domain-containing histidine kinase [Negativicutes bacterium]|nr:HAMP domain-containing histidine kinase [Negativicutes bacterium]
MRKFRNRYWNWGRFLSVSFICYIIGTCFMAWMCGDTINIGFIGKQAVFLLAGLLAFGLGLTAVHRISHYRMQKDSRHNYLHEFSDDIEAILERIGQGNFDARIDSEKYAALGHHVALLIDKINKMAEGLGGMETMRQDFVSNVSHEIQSPLTSIRGFVTLLKDNRLSREEQLHYIDIIENESLRLSRLAENLLRLSTLESKGVMNPSAYSLTRQMQETILLLEPQWTAKNIEVSLSGENMEITADKDLLNQVWINLLNNSMKFTPVGGKIDISVKASDNELEIVIMDTGTGMDEETMTHIFERFYMADKARSKTAGGSGLGLSIAKKIVEMHQGSICVSSSLNEGSVFKVVLPLKNS